MWRIHSHKRTAAGHDHTARGSGNVAIGHRHKGSTVSGCRTDVALDRFPDEEELAPAERADVVDAFEKDDVLQARADGARVVVDAFGQLIRGKVRLAHLHALLLVIGIE